MKEELDKLLKENTQLKVRIIELEALLEQVLAALSKMPQTSDKPPSIDPLSTQTKHNQAKRRRKRGSKFGHKGSHRKLVPIEEVTELVACVPFSCKHCNQPLNGYNPSPQRHQVTEPPPIKPLVTEYQLHKLQCSKCCKHTRARLPEGSHATRLPKTLFGFDARHVSSGSRTELGSMRSLQRIDETHGQFQEINAVTIGACAVDRALDRNIVRRRGVSIWVAPSATVRTSVYEDDRRIDISARELLSENAAASNAVVPQRPPLPNGWVDEQSIHADGGSFSTPLARQFRRHTLLQFPVTYGESRHSSITTLSTPPLRGAERL